MACSRAQPVPADSFGITGSDAQHIWAITAQTFCSPRATAHGRCNTLPMIRSFSTSPASGPAGRTISTRRGFARSGFGVIYHSTGDGIGRRRSDGHRDGRRLGTLEVGCAMPSDGRSQVFHTTGDGTWTDLSRSVLRESSPPSGEMRPISSSPVLHLSLARRRRLGHRRQQRHDDMGHPRNAGAARATTSGRSARAVCCSTATRTAGAPSRAARNPICMPCGAGLVARLDRRR